MSVVSALLTFSVDASIQTLLSTVRVLSTCCTILFGSITSGILWVVCAVRCIITLLDAGFVDQGIVGIAS